MDNIERIDGPDRFATAAAVAGRIGGSEVFVVEGRDPDPARGWPDAVAVAALAAATARPILLTDSEALPTVTRDALAGVASVTIVGGEVAVSDTVRQEITATGATVERVAGRTRYETSVAVAERMVAAGLDPSRPWVATGEAFADALVAGPAAASVGSVLLLVDGEAERLGPAVASFLGEDLDVPVVVGGVLAVNPRVAADLGARQRR